MENDAIYFMGCCRLALKTQSQCPKDLALSLEDLNVIQNFPIAG
jgi:hypothetical protein